MFTGIVQDVGKVVSVTRKGSCHTIAISSAKIAKDVDVSESVCSNGACLTVTKKSGAVMYFDVMPQTLDTTTWGKAKAGDAVNLEGSLRLNGKVDGHFVLGHVDTVTRIVRLDKGKDGIAVVCALPAAFAPYVVDRGSVCLHGISLTVASCDDEAFTVKIIPYTWEHTALSSMTTGSAVNVEFDYLAKVILKGRGSRDR
jgi:riboflavin synthase